MLAIAASTAVPSAKEETFWRTASLWGCLLGGAMVVRMIVDVLAPFDVEGFFLSQSAGGYSSLVLYPRRTLLGVAIVLVFLAAGFAGARRTNRVPVGSLSAVAAGVIGFGVTLAGTTIRAVVYPAAAPGEIDPPVWGVALFAIFGLLLGTIGAMLGKGCAPLGSSEAFASNSGDQ
jgi:hypothetical protein